MPGTDEVCTTYHTRRDSRFRKKNGKQALATTITNANPLRRRNPSRIPACVGALSQNATERGSRGRVKKGGCSGQISACELAIHIKRCSNLWLEIGNKNPTALVSSDTAFVRTSTYYARLLMEGNQTQPLREEIGNWRSEGEERGSMFLLPDDSCEWVVMSE